MLYIRQKERDFITKENDWAADWNDSDDDIEYMKV